MSLFSCSSFEQDGAIGGAKPLKFLMVSFAADQSKAFKINKPECSAFNSLTVLSSAFLL